MALARIAATFAFVLVIYSSSAAACVSYPETTKTVFDEAREVFRARVTRAELANYVLPIDPKKRAFIVHVHYQLKEVLKGNPTKKGPISMGRLYLHDYGDCGTPLLLGADYLFYVFSFDDNAPKEIIGSSSGNIDLLATKILPDNEARAEEIMAEARLLRTPQ